MFSFYGARLQWKSGRHGWNGCSFCVEEVCSNGRFEQIPEVGVVLRSLDSEEWDILALRG